MITQGLILTRRLNLLVGNVAKLVTLKRIGKVLMLATKPMDDDVAWWVDSGATVHVYKDRCWFKTYELLNDGSILHMGNESTTLVHRRGCVYFRLNIVNDNIDMSKDGLIPAFDMDTEKCKTCVLTKITKKPFQNVKRETEVLELIHSDLCDLHATLSLGNKKYFVTFIDDASRAESRVLGGIECIFVGYTEHSKAFRFFVIEPNESMSINSIIESRDAIFDENRFSSVLRPSQRSLKYGTEDIGGSVVPEEVTEEVVQQPKIELRKNKKNRTPMNFGPEFQLYITKGTKDEKEAINDEMDSIMGNNTWVLADLPPGCKPLGCKWIFKRKLKANKGFKQKSGIYYFDTYAPVARISTIRLLIAMTSIHNLIIHQIDMKTAFLNGKLEEEIYMNQPQGFIMPGNENKVCKLIKSSYGLK
ncbi:zinc finger, CCHC-type containing protein [Tanacetum coccineum]